MVGIDPYMGTVAVKVGEATDVAAVRRAATSAAGRLGFDPEQTGRVALVATEAAANLLRHGGGGEVLVSAARDGRTGVELIALDKGPGIADLRRSMEDGYSTVGGAGTGLGAMGRLAPEFEIHSQPGKGTALLARLYAGATARPEEAVEVGGVSVPMIGEEVCGDAWSVQATAGGSYRIVAADGLGHGPAAGEAARRALETFARNVELDDEELLERMHAELHVTRGASVALVRLCPREHAVEFTGVGNVAGVVLEANGQRRGMVSYPGTVGHMMHRVRRFRYAWPEDALVVVHSDGISSHWTLHGYRGLLERSATLIGATLYRDFGRSRDDATVVVARRRTA